MNSLLTRREAILRVSAMLGGAALVGQTAMLAACSPEGAKTQTPDADADEALFTDSDLALLDEIAETMLPETSTPGAKAAGVGAFMALMVKDAYYPPDQAIFRTGMATVDARCRDASGRSFTSASPVDRLELLEALDAEQFEAMRNQPPDAPRHFFRMMKELALLGYFTSEIGYTQAMRYVETPGRFDPCAPYAPGEKAWANPGF
ncbi:MAG: gluconate 2-dehydrogenase subunit 3 family protein [Gammaproteobacteria bacterium]|nr:gluconate 2-dehydrogenase subunit 3 family protein [Gammaproteobacteria bacterium]